MGRERQAIRSEDVSRPTAAPTKDSCSGGTDASRDALQDEDRECVAPTKYAGPQLLSITRFCARNHTNQSIAAGLSIASRLAAFSSGQPTRILRTGTSIFLPVRV